MSVKKDNITESDAIIIGAGVLGLSLAYHLAQMKQRVVVLDREPSFAQHASGKNAGMIRQLYRHPQLTEWANQSIRTWPVELKQASFKQTGSIVVGRRMPNHHIELFREERLPKNNHTQSQLIPAIVCPSDGIIDPGDYNATLYRITSKKYARFHFSKSAISTELCSQTWNVRTTDGHLYRASWLVNSAGAWSNSLFSRHHPSRISVQPYARHVFLVSHWPANFMPYPNVGFYWDERNNWYMRQWSKTDRLVSICDKIAANPETFTPNPSIRHKLAEKLLRVLPGVGEKLRLGRSWHCFRLYTADQLPVWGQDPTLPGLFWLTAFGGFGMSTSFAAAKDAADHLTGQTTSSSNSDFYPERVQHEGHNKARVAL